MIFTYTEAQMREAIETEIKAAAPKAVVFSWWSGDMGPRGSMFNLRDRRRIYLESFSESANAMSLSEHCFNFANVRFGQLRHAVLFSCASRVRLGMGSMSAATGNQAGSGRVMAVFGLGAIFKIARRVIKLISINMIDYKPLRAWADKCFGDDVMQEAIVIVNGRILQGHSVIALKVDMGLQYAYASRAARVCLDTSYSSERGGLINAFKLRDVAPGFLRRVVGKGKLLVSHIASHLQCDVMWLGSRRCFQHCFEPFLL